MANKKKKPQPINKQHHNQPMGPLEHLPRPKGKFKNDFDVVNQSRHYYNILLELFASTFEWSGLPEYFYEQEADIYLERRLSEFGSVLFFHDPVLDQYLVHTYTGKGPITFYDTFSSYQVTAPNGYSKQFTREEAVVIWNSMYKTGEYNTVRLFADKLAQLDLTIMLNVNSQKQPYIIKTTKEGELTAKNIFHQIDTYEPAVFVNNDLDIMQTLDVLQLNTPFTATQLYELKRKYWDEALAFCGVSSSSNKKERMITEEANQENGESNALLLTRLKTRQTACDIINKRWGLNISVDFRKDLDNKMKLLIKGGENNGEVHNRTIQTDE